MKTKILVLATVWILAGLLSAEAQSQPCGCADKQDLLNLLNQTQIEIQESQFQMDSILAKERADGKLIMATTEGVNKLYEDIHKVAKSVAKKNYPGYSMDVVECTVKRTNTYSDCVELIKKHFYDIPQKACLANKNSRGSDQPYYEIMEMKSYLLQIMTAYNEKQKFILKMLDSLPKNCRPNNWFGYVVYQTVWASKIQKTTPPTDTSKPLGSGQTVHNGKSETSIHKRTYTGTILVEEGKASNARASAGWSLDEVGASTGRAYCTPKKPNVAWAFTAGTNNYANGESEGNAEFYLNVYPDKKYYAISMKFFTVNVTGQLNSYRNVSGGCKEGNDKYSNPVNTREAGGSYKIEEKLKSGSPDYLEGSKVEKPPLQQISQKQANTSVEQTFEIRTRWTLRRLPAK